MREVIALLTMCTLVCAGAWMSARLSRATGNLSCIWITNGVISAFVLTAPRQSKWKLFIAGEAASLAVDLAMGTRLAWAGWFAFCNSSEALVTILTLQHFRTRAEATTREALIRIALYGIVLGPLAGGVLAAPVVRQIESSGFLEAVRVWFFADALGSAASLPATIFFLTQRRNSNSRVRIADIGWAVILAGIAAAVFWQTRYPLIFLLLPPVAFTLFRFRLEGAIYGTSAVVLIAAIFTAEAHGPFALTPVATIERVSLFQIFGLILFASCVPLGYSVDERYRLAAELKRANRKLGRLILLDPLTGVLNRRGFDETLASEWLRGCETSSELSLVYLDLDFFKSFNDNYGHQSGDDCLRAVARAVADSLRPEDSVGRYGGEEFVILLPGRSLESARTTTGRIATAILELKIPHKGSPFGTVTASFGLATLQPKSDTSPYALMRMADDALYAAKRKGRDRVECMPGTPAALVTS